MEMLICELHNRTDDKGIKGGRESDIFVMVSYHENIRDKTHIKSYKSFLIINQKQPVCNGFRLV